MKYVKYNERLDNNFNAKGSDFTKNKIYEVYAIMIDAVEEYFTIFEEDKYFELLSVLRKSKVVLPEDIYIVLCGFVDNELTPLFENPNTFFEDIPNGQDLETVRTRNRMYTNLMNGFLKKVEDFGEQALRPILIG